MLYTNPTIVIKRPTQENRDKNNESITTFLGLNSISPNNNEQMTVIILPIKYKIII